MYALVLIKLVSIFYSSQTGKIKPLVFFCESAVSSIYFCASQCEVLSGMCALA